MCCVLEFRCPPFVIHLESQSEAWAASGSHECSWRSDSHVRTLHALRFSETAMYCLQEVLH